MSVLRMLLPGSTVVGDLTASGPDVLDALADLYAYPDPLPRAGWVRASMVSTLDGAIAGPDGVSASISGPADRAVLSVLRALADVVLVGAGTARAEGYRVPVPKPQFQGRRRKHRQAAAPVLAVVSGRGDLDGLEQVFADGEDSLLVTCAAADVEGLRSRLGGHRVVVAGESTVDPLIAVAQLAGAGLRRVLLEGGPRLLGSHVEAGRLDELCLTWSPVLVGGLEGRLALGGPAKLPARPAHLLEADGMLLGRWVIAAGR
ncbi:MAG: dihydrofolate reductase family protein [Kineosporiaceae bacterium]